MANYKKITSLSLLTLLSLATFSATQYSKVYAQDPESSSSVNIKTIDGQLAIADKEAEPLYKEMDSIQMNIEKIKASRFKPAEIAITTEIQQLENLNETLLEKFYQKIGNRIWNTKEEALNLISETTLSPSEKELLKDYFNKDEVLRKKLKENDLLLDQETAQYNAKLAILTQQADKIYEKHGITKDILAAYYMQTGMEAD
ncbi:chromosome assembly protein [Streptococcus uberis]|uniref:Chromosome assembly protein n=1 Tax=Streptococcus uberis TaxID=1349 RepID=A0A6L6G774_STRUB|nr:chromosome assembly protein [Streptococcus uberis]MCK1228152.1 chromosome assembly protein [Streptococcus uberis]MTB56067.1 chromosome assembly protein [Streptococcus uberis]MTC84570.1 chromosome assembly protein [Streptococcus uberis]MTC86445.1 chromosome assembly protein [Streptococcus uberis]MTD00977.1 chromosome assembly protein [Streptococcus uberis]